MIAYPVCQSNVIVDEVVKRGVTPFPVTMFGVTVPLQRIAVAPPPVLPVEKYVTVPEPPVPAGKSMLATGETEPELSAHPPEVRATLTRA